MIKIVAVTACITGIAHSYMAKSSLEKYSKELGADIRVEVQGAMGMEDKLSQEEIDQADVVIFAVDTTVSEKDRFEDKKILEVGTSEVVQDGLTTIKKAIEISQ